MITYTGGQSTSRTHSTRRFPSGFEASEPRQRLCSQCRLPGHTRNQHRCPVNIRLAQQEFSSDILARPSPPAIVLAYSTSDDSHTNSQVQAIAQGATQWLESGTNTQEVPETLENPEISANSEAITVDTRPIWPGRPELIYKAYLAEKEAWLAVNPTVQPAQYRKKRGLTSWSKQWCRQNKKFLPSARLNLQTETLSSG